MKKFILSSVVLLFAMFSFGQFTSSMPKTELSVLDSFIYSRGTNLNEWEEYYKRNVVEKNSWGLPVRYMTYYLSNGSWLNGDTTVYNYYSNGHLESYVSYNSDTTQCKKYDTDGRLIFEYYKTNSNMGTLGSKTYYYYSGTSQDPDSMIVYKWNDGSSTWTLSGKYVYTYNEEGKIIEYLSYYWSGGWENSDKKIYRYNNDGLLDSLIEIYYDDFNFVWKNHYLTCYYYYNNTDLVSSEVQLSWDDNANQWKNNKMYNYIYYDNGLLQRKLFYEMDQTSGTWQAQSKDFYEYDAQGNVVAVYDSTMDNGQWIPRNKTTYTYDQFGNQTLVVNYKWDTNDNTWHNLLKKEYFYTRAIFSSVPQQATLDFRVYPNPVQNLLFFSGLDTKVKITIYSIDGRIFQQSRIGTNAKYINVSSLPPGSYILKIVTGHNKVFVHKFVKL